ncbi:3-methylfumaryl-CoA hydratase [Kibdelosporangium banguiense]|uniref:3-methylfumaryl-CoA hydratase n=1 Tax=Kibdelosporangium banguiense TaxID=1365924 RepID=A0ABS4TXY0_9PSEU|nr:MaoC family dehydratase N-terminal domain-containing protein [Kibdelosporangium banguiense]MBP2329262.1 3-methylfumaryl-CoA hydratase [Kibdelosporangium banguiense]
MERTAGMIEEAERTEVLLPEPAEALGALLDVPVPHLERHGLPLLWHWVYLLDRPAQADLGPDGHPVRNTVPAPPGPGRRRMWAGGRVRTRGPLRCGYPATKRTRVLSVHEKHGRTGALTFVVVQHQVSQVGLVVIDEQQDIVYRDATSGSPTTNDNGPALQVADDEWAIDISPSLLFRFSALTYNAHRIHYDRDYCRDIEGYPGLLTHGPLQALAMTEAARARGCHGDQAFEYRLTSPLFDGQGLVARAVRDHDQTTTIVRDRYGRRTATGTLRSLAR